MPTDDHVSHPVQLAVDGDKDALESLIRQIQDPVYGLAIRMLWHPEDAEDATQEILIKIVTHLSSFRGESSFSTWCYRIATNHLLTTRKCRAERIEMTFEKCEEEIHKGIAHSWSHSTPEAEHSLMVEEVMIGCAQGILLCLDRNLRLAYILGEILEVNSHEGAEILSITAAAFRQRLSRARTLLRGFMQHHCGLVDPTTPCNCKQQVSYAIKTGIANPRKLLFSAHPRYDQGQAAIEEVLNQVSEVQRVAVLFRRLPDYAAPDKFVDRINLMIGPHPSEGLRLKGAEKK